MLSREHYIVSVSYTHLDVYKRQVVHYTVEEVWLDKNGNPISDLAKYMEENLGDALNQYPGLGDMLKEYTLSLIHISLCHPRVEYRDIRLNICGNKFHF